MWGDMGRHGETWGDMMGLGLGWGGVCGIGCARGPCALFEEEAVEEVIEKEIMRSLLCHRVNEQLHHRPLTARVGRINLVEWDHVPAACRHGK